MAPGQDTVIVELLKESSKSIAELHEKVNRQGERLAKIEENLAGLNKAVYGNGKAGMQDRLSKIESTQEFCSKNKEDSKWLLGAIIAIASLVLHFIKNN